MRAVQFSEFGGPEVLEVVDLPDPQPAAVRSGSRSMRPASTRSTGRCASGPMGGDLPQRTGREVAGVVDELGDGVDDVAVGDRVFGFAAGGGGVAELALLENYAPIPPSLDFARGGGAAGRDRDGGAHARSARRRRRQTPW